jgi:hypothetical protein
MKYIFAAAAFAVAVLSTTAHAQILPDFTAPSIAVTGGTMGIGPEVDFHTTNTLLGIRIGGDFFSLSHDFTTDHIQYDGHLHLANGGITADYYPFGSGLRLSLGGLLNGDDVRLTATPSGSVKIGNQVYNAGDVGYLYGKATYNSVVPYFGLGYKFRLFGNFFAAFDAGVIYEGNGKLDLTAAGPLSGNAIFQQNLSAESGRVRHDLSYASWYPDVMLTVGYRF